MDEGKHEGEREGKSNKSLRRTKNSKEAKLKRRWRMAIQNIRASALCFLSLCWGRRQCDPLPSDTPSLLPKSEGKCSPSIWGEDCSAPHGQRSMLPLKEIWENSCKQSIFPQCISLCTTQFWKSVLWKEMSQFPETLVWDLCLSSKLLGSFSSPQNLACDHERFSITLCTAYFNFTLWVSTDRFSESCLGFTLLEDFIAHSLWVLNTRCLLCAVCSLFYYAVLYWWSDKCKARNGWMTYALGWDYHSCQEPQDWNSAGSSQLFPLNLDKLNPTQTTLQGLLHKAVERTCADVQISEHCSYFKCHSHVLFCRKLWVSLYLDYYTPTFDTLTYSSQLGLVLRIKRAPPLTDISLAVYFGFEKVSPSFNSFSKAESSIITTSP